MAVSEINTHVFQETVTSVYDVTRSAICSLVVNDNQSTSCLMPVSWPAAFALI